MRTGKHERCRAGKALRRMPGQRSRGNSRQHVGDERVAGSRHLARETQIDEGHRHGHPHGARDIFGAGTRSAFLAAAVHKGFERNPAAHEERADSLRRTEFVARDADGVDSE